MGFEAMKKAAVGAARGEREDEARRDAAFERRVETQQFLNQVAPIIRAYARGEVPAERLLEGPALRDYAETARRLAVAVAARLTDRMPADVDPVLVRILMPPMAEYVADKARGNLPVDVTADAAAVVAALDLVDPKFDFNLFERMPVSREASVKMTVAAGTAVVVARLAWYDFRAADPAAVAKRVLDAVIVRAASVLSQTAAGMEERDRASLMQSQVKHYSEIMADALANRAAATLAALKGLDAAGREAWYRANDPVGEAIVRFETLTGVLGGTQMTWEAAMKDPSVLLGDRPQSSPGAK